MSMSMRFIFKIDCGRCYQKTMNTLNDIMLKLRVEDLEKQRDRYIRDLIYYPNDVSFTIGEYECLMSRKPAYRNRPKISGNWRGYVTLPATL